MTSWSEGEIVPTEVRGKGKWEGNIAKREPKRPGEKVVIFTQEWKVVHWLAQWETMIPGQNTLNF